MSQKLALPHNLKPPRPQSQALLMLLLYCLALSLTGLSLWLALFGQNRVDLYGEASFLGLSVLWLALGGCWWGETVKTERTLILPIIPLAMLLSWLLALALLAIWPMPGDFSAPGLKDVIFFSILSLPIFFLLGIGPPFFASLAFPQEKGAGRGIFILASIALLALAIGALLALITLSLWKPKPIALVSAVGLFSLALSARAWISRDRGPDRAPLRFWPSESLGLWTGEKSYGRDLMVTGRVSKTLAPSVFLGALAGGAAISAGLGLSPAPAMDFSALSQGFWLKVISVPLAMALGSSILGPALAALVSPMAALGLDLLFLSLSLAFPFRGPNFFGEFTSLFWTLCCLGALWPLAARVSLFKEGFFASNLGRLDLWASLGLSMGLALALAWRFSLPLYGKPLAFIALLASYLSLGPSFSWSMSAVLAAGLGLWYRSL
jgi:hypothetical protein